MPDDLDALIEERTKQNPEFPALVASAEERRILKNAVKGINFLIGQVMKKFRAEDKYADPILVREILEELIQSSFKKLEQKQSSG